MRPSWCLVLVVSVLLVGCRGGGHRREESRPAERPGPGPGPDRPERGERADDRRDAAVEDRTGWEKLGERTVHGKGDHDAIPVGGREGRFRRIMIVCEHSALEMHDVVVHFGDGSRHSPDTRLVFGKNTRSRVIDLPGDARVITRVDFRYGNLPGNGRAQVELWAR